MKYSLCVLIIFLALQPLNLAAESRGLQFMHIKTQTGEEVGLYEESHALLIGVSDYTAGWPSLPGVKKDVQAVQTALEEHGFQVVLVENPTRSQLDQAFSDFINQYGRVNWGKIVLNEFKDLHKRKETPKMKDKTPIEAKLTEIMITKSLIEKEYEKISFSLMRETGSGFT